MLIISVYNYSFLIFHNSGRVFKDYTVSVKIPTDKGCKGLGLLMEGWKDKILPYCDKKDILNFSLCSRAAYALTAFNIDFDKLDLAERSVEQIAKQGAVLRRLHEKLTFKGDGKTISKIVEIVSEDPKCLGFNAVDCHIIVEVNNFD